MNVKNSEQWSPEEHEKLLQIQMNVKEHKYSIVDCSYTGKIDNDHIAEILRYVKVTFVYQRALCMREFG